jgi:hypothetical protein
LRITVLLAVLLALPASAHAVTEPPQIIGGANSQWVSGDLLSQTGLNCSTAILGEPYTEIMVSGIASYGGLPSVPKVGDNYWTGFLVSIPGNPCGSGSSSVVTSLVMPPNTSVDSSRQIRCFGLPRNATPTTPWQELTGTSWSFLNSSGPYCPTQPSISPYHQGALQFGFRPLASGQLFWIFVPVTSSAQLIGAQTSPAHGFRWLTDATGVYANPGLSTVWANVFPAGAGNLPRVYFTRDPTVVPFWNDAAPAGQKNMAEWFANLYSAGKTGTLCFELYEAPTATGPVQQTCTSPGVTFNSAIPNPLVCPFPCSVDLWLVVGEGPNKGYTPFFYGDNETYTIKWTFTYSGTGSPVSATTTFKTLNGADPDHDGVGLNDDGCPTAKGSLPNGCLPGVEPDPDQDGVYGSADLCPTVAGEGSLNGCVGGIIPPPPPPPEQPKTLVATLLSKTTLFKRASLAKGAPVKFECTVDSTAKGTLSISKKVATKLGIKTKRSQKTVAIATGKGPCKAAGGGSLKLKLARAYAKKVRNAKKKFPAALAIKLTAPGQLAVTLKRAVKIG